MAGPRVARLESGGAITQLCQSFERVGRELRKISLCEYEKQIRLRRDPQCLGATIPLGEGVAGRSLASREYLGGAGTPRPSSPGAAAFAAGDCCDLLSLGMVEGSRVGFERILRLITAYRVFVSGSSALLPALRSSEWALSVNIDTGRRNKDGTPWRPKTVRACRRAIDRELHHKLTLQLESFNSDLAFLQRSVDETASDSVLEAHGI